MSAILIFGGAEDLAFVVDLKMGRSSKDLGSSQEVEVDVALKMDAATEIGTCRHQHLTATSSYAGIDGFVDSHVIKHLAIAFGAIVFDVINTA